MDRIAFEETQALLRRQGLSVDRAEYDASTFGSWWVIVGGHPRRRVVWDGREAWLHVDVESSRLHLGLRVWDTLWSAEAPVDMAPARAVEVLQSHPGAC